MAVKVAHVFCYKVRFIVCKREKKYGAINKKRKTGKTVSILKERNDKKMVEQDTIRLLRECDAGVKMGIKSIEDVIDHVKEGKLKESLYESKDKHLRMSEEIGELLKQYCDGGRDECGKDPNPMAQAMAKFKTSAMLAVNDCDSTVADLMTDGCNMGVKSLGRYLNEYSAADERSKDIAKKLISMEKELAESVQSYL